MLYENKSLLEQHIDKLNCELNNLKTKCSNSATVEAPGASTTMIDNVVHELAEREKRRSNFLIFNLPENAPSKSEQIANDDISIKTILSKLKVPAEIEFKCFRLGRYDNSVPNRPPKRPLKISLMNNNHIDAIFEGFQKFKSDSTLNHLRIARDRTPLQSKLFSTLKIELDYRKSKGETNIRIKYKDDIPCIVTLPRSEN